MRTAAAALLFPLLAGSDRPAPAPLATYSFGMSLMTGMNSELFTLFVVKEFEGKVIEVQPITRGQFMMEAQGAVPSKANPSRINMFRKYRVDGCLLPPELDDGTRTVSDCGVFDELWKLRFWEYPFKDQSGAQHGLGWAESRTQPSPRQMLLLSGYGLHRLTDLACGEDLFRLLHDIGDPEWVDNYQKGY
jgi:hypothetical protein